MLKRLSSTPLAELAELSYLTVPEAADYTRRPSVNAFRKWAYKARLPVCRAGRAVLYRRRDLDRALSPQEPAHA